MIPPPPESPPARVAHYRIEREIGRGGMGVVYLARDERLEREVALKALPIELSRDADRVARLEREARVLASLDHPNLAVVHGLERGGDGALYLVLEHVRGETLAARLRGGPLGRNEALAVARQVAAGLAAAHERGVVHRDVKPGNVMLTPEGRVKLLDFGLARRVTSAVGAADDATLAAASSSAGEGTASYMSPERILGSAGDRRADVFAFGCLLYECLVGRKAFAGETVFGALGAALRARPDWSALAPDEPLRDLLESCLRKDPAERLANLDQAVERIAEAERDLAAPAAGPRPPAVPNNLPTGLPALVGRDAEVMACARALAAHRLLTLVGPGGAGKTRLALRLAAERADAFPDGAWFVDLSALASMQGPAERLAEILGLPDSGARPLVERLIEHLKDKAALLVLDNCEDAVASAGELAERLLAGCPRVRLLATSREPLGTPGGGTFDVPPLAYPHEGEPVDPAAIERHDAVRLFALRGRQVDPEFAVGPNNAEAIATITRAVGGHPLALELAAARLRVLAPAEIARRLDRALALLQPEDAAGDPRQRTLRATLDWSEEHLAEDDRRAFRRLAVFPSAWTVEAAAAVLAEDEDVVIDRLSRLATAWLIAVERGAEETRYRLDEVVRQFAAERLEHAGEMPATRERFLDWCVRFAEAAAPGLAGPEQGAWMARVDRESRNLMAAFDAEGDAGRELRLAAGLGYYWMVRGHYRIGRQLLERALARGPAQPSATRAEVLLASGRIAFLQGDLDEAGARFAGSAAMALGLGDDRIMVAAHNGAGLVAVARHDLAAAEAHYRRGLEAAQRHDDPSPICGLLDNLAALRWRQGDLAEARALHEESYRRATPVKLWQRIISSANGLGLIAQQVEDYDAARLWFGRGLDAVRRAGHRGYLVQSLWNLGEVSSNLGLHEEARPLIEEAMEIARSIDDRPNLAIGLAALAVIELRMKRPAAAARAAGEALAVARAIDQPRALAYLFEVAAELAFLGGSPAEAAEFLGAARRLRQGPLAPLSGADRRHVEMLTAQVEAALGSALPDAPAPVEDRAETLFARPWPETWA